MLPCLLSAAAAAARRRRPPFRPFFFQISAMSSKDTVSEKPPSQKN